MLEPLLEISAPVFSTKRKNNNNNNGYEFQKEGTQVNDLWTGLACDQAVLDASKMPGD
jgi:hypothetical protein